MVQRDTLAQTPCCQALKAGLVGLLQDSTQAAIHVLSRVNTSYDPFISLIEP